MRYGNDSVEPQLLCSMEQVPFSFKLSDIQNLVSSFAVFPLSIMLTAATLKFVSKNILNVRFHNLYIFFKYEGCSKINFRSAGKFKFVAIATHIVVASPPVNLNTDQFSIIWFVVVSKVKCIANTSS